MKRVFVFISGSRHDRARSFTRQAVICLCTLIFAATLSATPHTANAQTLVRRCNGLFDCLFTSKPANARVQSAPRRRNIPPQTRRKHRPSPGRRTRSAPSPTRSAPSHTSVPRHTPSVQQAPAEPAVIDKLDNARVVLVVGDFLAGGMAEGLEDAYADSPGVRVVDRSNGSSGFVRDDYYDWNKEISGTLEEEKPAVVIMMIGSNDRQQLTVGGQRENPRSDAWLKEYKRRVDRFAGTIEKHGLPLIWTGLPSFKSPSMTSDMLAFNDIYKKAAETAGGEFVDIWDGFVDEDGNFISDGPDINGQTVRLRGSDGINLSRAARRKVAYYVEKPLNKLLGDAVSPDVGETDINNLPAPDIAPGELKSLDRTPPVSLADPDLDGGSELLGGPAPSDGPKPETPARRLVVEGLAPAARTGRADDFGLGEDAPSPPPSSRTNSPDKQTTTAIEP